MEKFCVWMLKCVHRKFSSNRENSKTWYWRKTMEKQTVNRCSGSHVKLSASRFCINDWTAFSETTADICFLLKASVLVLQALSCCKSEKSCQILKYLLFNLILFSIWFLLPRDRLSFYLAFIRSMLYIETS